MDVSRYARFKRPGHAVTGDRSRRGRDWMRPETRVGTDYAHAIADDHSRLAYVELHNDERATTVTGFVERALACHLPRHGVHTKRLMTDNAFSYTKNRSLQDLLATRSIRHLTTQPYRPRTNGKAERFHQTIACKGAYGPSYRSHHQRNQAPPHRPQPLQHTHDLDPGGALSVVWAGGLGGWLFMRLRSWSCERETGSSEVVA